jgi:hypothetical protein
MLSCAYNKPSIRADSALPNDAFSVSVREKGTISLLYVSGRLTSFEIGAPQDAVARLLKQGRKDIVLNLGGLQYLDSSGIGSSQESTFLL